MKNKFIAFFLLLLIIPFFSVQTKAEDYNGFDFERLDNSVTQQVIKTVNSSKTVQNHKLQYTESDIENAVQYKEYYSPDLYKYSEGSFREFLENNSQTYYYRFEIFSPEYPDASCFACVEKEDKKFRISYDGYSETYWAHDYEKNYVRNNIQRTAAKYTDGGKAYICAFDFLRIGVICDENDIPKYVVCRDSEPMFSERINKTETDNEEIKKLLTSFDTLYNSYDWKVYDDNEHQYVFDFDFFVDVDKAIHGTLPDDYVFEPHGLESMAKNTIKTIDGRAYRFSKNGVCTGLYTGWSNTKNGKRFFRRGELVKGKTTINGKEYEFDKKGYLKQ